MLSPATLTEMCAPVVISDPEAWTAGHGPGIELYRQGERVHAGHGGSMPGYLAHLAVHRPSRTGPVVFAGAYALPGRRIGDLNRHILTTVLDAGPAPVKPWSPPRGGAAEQETDGDLLVDGEEPGEALRSRRSFTVRSTSRRTGKMGASPAPTTERP